MKKQNYEVFLNDVEYPPDNPVVLNLWLEVSASLTPFYPATHTEPAEGWFAEDIRIVRILECLDEDENNIVVSLDTIKDTLYDAMRIQDESIQEQIGEQEWQRLDGLRGDYDDSKRGYWTMKVNWRMGVVTLVSVGLWIILIDCIWGLMELILG